jgi:hypothetical protein
MTAKLRALLTKTDEELFNRGACHIYAVELKKGWPQLSIMRAGNAQSTHVYGVIRGHEIDVHGPVNEAEYLNSNDYTAWEVSVDDLTTIDRTQSSANGPLNKWRHYLEPQFVSRASERARRHIARHLQNWREIGPQELF